MVMGNSPLLVLDANTMREFGGDVVSCGLSIGDLVLIVKVSLPPPVEGLEGRALGMMNLLKPPADCRASRCARWGGIMLVQALRAIPYRDNNSRLTIASVSSGMLVF